MTNELKPCPFCGEKACIEVFNGHMNFPKFRVECSTCEVNLRLKQTRDEAIEAWNTRQPAFDWKPIEELSREPLTSISDLVIYNRNSGIYVIPNIWVIKGVILISEYDYENKRPIEDIQRKYTHYALLTPPQTNQS